jgi:hypothetical protein
MYIGLQTKTSKTGQHERIVKKQEYPRSKTEKNRSTTGFSKKELMALTTRIVFVEFNNDSIATKE